MKRIILGVLLVLVTAAHAKTVTYNHLEEVNLQDQGIPSDERAMNVLIADGDMVYGATSGDKCHIFQFDPATATIKVLATLPGPNTVMKGMVLVGDTIYVGTMLTQQQLWWNAHKTDPSIVLEDVNLLPIDPSLNTGHLYKIIDILGAKPKLEDLGILVAKQGIHTMAVDQKRGLIYGVTSPNGRFFIHDIATGKMQDTSFGLSYKNVSNHMAGGVEVKRELADLIPGEAEWNNRLIPKAMHVTRDGMMYTSGWNGRILKYDPEIEDIQKRFTIVGWIPSVPGRQYWNRIDAIVERGDDLFMGTSDGYIIRLNKDTHEMRNLGKPIRSIEVMGMAFSPLDGKLYGVSGGGLEGMSRFWSCDLTDGSFEVDFPALQVFKNRRRVGAVASTADGTLVMSEAFRVANLHVLTPGETVEWEKGGMLREFKPRKGPPHRTPDGRFDGHKVLNVDFYPIPSSMHGGSGYTAIQADNDGKVYVGTAYYGKHGQLTQLDPKTVTWRSLFRTDELTHQHGRGQGIPGKIHTKLRLGTDGKIYGAMKQGYEMQYSVRPDIGEAPEGSRGSQHTCHLFVYDPATDETKDLGPGYLQEGITAFDIDVDRRKLYSATVPGVFFLVTDLDTGRTMNMGQISHAHPKRYMPRDPGNGRIYHSSETTPAGRNFMTVWDPEEYRLRDVEVIAEEGFSYRAPYASCTGSAGANTLYGMSGDYLFEMDLDDSKNGTFHVRPVCKVGVDGSDKHSGMQSIERGPDGRIYWASGGGRNIPLDVFAWDPKTETKTYLGACGINGEFITGSYSQGIAFDKEGNMSMHILYGEISEKQKKHWKIPEDFFYEDIKHQEHFLTHPNHIEGTYYSVFYVKNATSIR